MHSDERSLNAPLLRLGGVSFVFDTANGRVSICLYISDNSVVVRLFDGTVLAYFRKLQVWKVMVQANQL